MGITVQGGYAEYGAFTQALGDKEYHYDYPQTSDNQQLNWHPKSELHRTTLPKLMQRGRVSRDAMASRYPEWRKIDQNTNIFIPKSEDEILVQLKDPKKPSNVIIPVSVAVRETLLTYFVATLLNQEFYFGYDGAGPEDTVGAILLQHLIQKQMVDSGADLALITQWKDSLTYGIGIAAPKWTKLFGQRSRWKTDGYTNFWGKFIPTGTSQYTQTELLYEGNEIENIDPYLYLPDPSVSCHKIQDGEFVGWMALENRMNLVSRETAGSEGLFNCKYLEHCSGTSSLANTEHGRGDRTGTDIYSQADQSRGVKNNIWIMYLYVKIIPREWGLGASEEVEKWMFAVANDQVIVRAQPLGLDHNLFPVCVCAPDFDGYSISPTSQMELIYPLQKTIDWSISSHVLNQRKTVNNTYIADPYMINVETLKKAMGSPGGIVLTRRASWGKGVKDGIMQLATSDITRGNINDAVYLTQVIEQITGAAGFMQGVTDTNAPERRTKAEFQGTQSGAQGRMGLKVRNIYSMSMRPMGKMLASHLIQLMSQDTYVKATGDWEQLLREEYGLDVQDGKTKVSPMDLDINYDILAHDGRLPQDDPQTMLNLYQMAIQHPLLSRRFDIVRMYQSIARRYGEKNIRNFVIKASVLPNNKVEDMYNAGMLSALGGGANAAA